MAGEVCSGVTSVRMLNEMVIDNKGVPVSSCRASSSGLLLLMIHPPGPSGVHPTLSLEHLRLEPEEITFT